MGYVPSKARKNTGTGKAKLVPGKYESVIIDVREAEGFAPGEAFVVMYQLFKDGNKFVYSETFIDNYAEDRTAKFLDRMAEYGYNTDDLSSIIGLREELELLKQKRGGGIFLNVYSRRHLAHEGDEG